MKLMDCRFIANEVIQEFKNEFKGGSIAGGSYLDKFTNLDEWKIHFDKNESLDINVMSPVRSTTYFLVNGVSNPLGIIDIRHRLNDKLLKFGGHIGYSVRVSERNKGYAKIMLKKGLEQCNNLGIKSVLITCDDLNAASIKVIESSGGLLENCIKNESSSFTRRYWITLE